ncbi:response regulator [Longimicrobium sp.]|uniref:response regulator n=1 Tax=Longimicrobium sp. TaxID=2029185 RepID=UPI002E356E36|nr:response regulator [Longimicrobium sp.]HEX6037762.1 response regulator [Longimicrobium sp.]
MFLLMAESAHPEHGDARAETSRSTPHVLVVDDEPTILAAAASILKAAGLEVSVARDGVAALELVRAMPEGLHLLLSDVCMPGMGGVELGIEVARVAPAAAVILMSGRSDAALQHRVRANGFRFLPKPFAASLLLAMVTSTLQASSRRHDRR